MLLPGRINDSKGAIQLVEKIATSCGLGSFFVKKTNNKQKQVSFQRCHTSSVCLVWSQEVNKQPVTELNVLERRETRHTTEDALLENAAHRRTTVITMIRGY